MLSSKMFPLHAVHTYQWLLNCEQKGAGIELQLYGLWAATWAAATREIYNLRRHNDYFLLKKLLHV